MDVKDIRKIPVAAKSQAKPEDDLEIEKKWLQLVKVDQEQFAYFFEKYHDRIFQYVFLRMGNHDLAGDLTGEVFNHAWRHIDRFFWQGYSFGAWLFQIARWVIGHEIQRQKVRRETEFVPEQHDQVVPGDPETEYLADGDRELVRMCVGELSTEVQDVFVLHYWMGMTVKQVALVMKIPVGTVSSHLRRGRQTLMVRLRKLGFDGEISPAVHRIITGQAKQDSILKVIDKAIE